MKFVYLLTILILTNISCAQENTNNKSILLKNEKNKILSLLDKKYLFIIKKHQYIQQKEQNNTILILDSEQNPAYKSSFFLNKNKIIKYLKINKNGLYKNFIPIIKAPSNLNDIFSINDKYLHNTINLLTTQQQIKLLKLHHKSTIINQTKRSIPHGEYIFLILAKNNPKSNFIIAPFPELQKNIFCDFKDNPQKAYNFYSIAFNSLIKELNSTAINYVNISYASML